MDVELKILSSENDYDVHYLPHGIRTLAVKVNNISGAKRRIVIRPTNRSNQPSYYVAHESTKEGKNSNSKDLKIIWGGGMTEGFQLVLDPNKWSNLFFLIVHDSDDVSSYSFSIEAVEVTKAGKEKSILTTKQVNLIPPTHYDKDIVTKNVNFESVYLRTIEFEGRKIPEYESRWFANSIHDYSFTKSDYPPFVLKYEEREEFVSGEVISIGIRTSNGIKMIATISGDLERSKIHVDLFNFINNYYYVLRVWLYWINDFFEGNRLVGGKAGGGAGRRMTTRSVELRAWKQNVIEVPDAERFDLVVEKKGGKVVFVGTDLHWRETWWSVVGDFAHLRFASLTLVPVLIKNLPQLIKPYLAKRKDSYDYDPASELKTTLANKLVPKASGLMITEESKREDATRITELGHGLHRKHVPYLLISKLLPDYCSREVTKL